MLPPSTIDNDSLNFLASSPTTGISPLARAPNHIFKVAEHREWLFTLLNNWQKRDFVIGMWPVTQEVLI